MNSYHPVIFDYQEFSRLSMTNYDAQTANHILTLLHEWQSLREKLLILSLI